MKILTAFFLLIAAIAAEANGHWDVYISNFGHCPLTYVGVIYYNSPASYTGWTVGNTSYATPSANYSEFSVLPGDMTSPAHLAIDFPSGSSGFIGFGFEFRKSDGTYYMISTGQNQETDTVTLNIICAGDGCVYTPPRTTTNITACVQNTTANTVNGYWKNGDGSSAGGQPILPGQTICKTVTVNLDGSTPGQAGWNSQPGGVDPNSDHPFYSDTNGGGGLLNYTNGGITGSTNDIANGGSDQILFTNNLGFPAPGGPVSDDATLKAGFGALHQDGKDLLAGLGILHNDLLGIKTSVDVSTNELGQVIYAIYHQTNSDQSPVWVGNVTNNASQNAAAIKAAINGLTNSLTSDLSADNSLRGISNLLSALTENPTNADIATEGTQLAISNLLSQLLNGQGTNNLSLTNYATETTLRGMSNLMARAYDTNGLPSTNDLGADLASAVAAGDAAGAAGKGVFDTLAGQLTPGDPNGHYGSDGGTWTITVPYGPHPTIDLNPFHRTWVSDLAQFVRNLIAWIFAISLYGHNIGILLNQLGQLGASRQATVTVKGVKGFFAQLLKAIPIVGEGLSGAADTFVGFAVAGIITTAMLALPVYFASWFGLNTAMGSLGNPFNGSMPGTVGTSVWMVDQFFPLAFMVYCVISGFLYQLGIGGVVWVAQTTIRFIASI